MSKEIYEWDATAAGNDFAAADGGWPEGMLRSDVNNAGREVLSTLRRWHDDMEWQTVRTQGPDGAPTDVGTFARTGVHQFTITLSGVDLTSFFPVGRLLQIQDGVSSGVHLITQVVSRTYTGGNLTTVNTTVSSLKEMDPGSSDVLVYFSKSARGLALEELQSEFFVPETADSAGIQAAINDADTSGGGTVLLTAASYSIDAAIDFGVGINDIVIMGDAPRTVLRQDGGADLPAMFTVASGPVTFRNLRIDGFTSAQTADPDLFQVTTANRVVFQDCEFEDCDIGVSLNSSTLAAVSFRNCVFSEFQEYGIYVDSVDDVQDGQITGCRFNGSSISAASSGGIRVSGSWTISDNYFQNMGHASNVPVAIHLMNEIGTNEGGYRCTVTGNTIDADNANNGTGIEVGGRDNTVTGNTVTMGSSGRGIYVRSTQAGQNIEGNVVSGNTVRGALNCLECNDLTASSSFSGNVLFPNSSGTGILCDGDTFIIEGNNISGGTEAIEMSTNSVDCSVFNNILDSPTADGCLIDGDRHVFRGNTLIGSPTDGFDIAATSASVRVHDNHIADSPTNVITNASTTAAWWRNEEVPWIQVHGDTDTDGWTSSTPVDLSEVTQEDLPGEGGIGDYMIDFTASNNDVSRGAIMQMWTGTTGDSGDTLLFTATTCAAQSTRSQRTIVTVTDGTHTKFGLSVKSDAGTGDNYQLNVFYIWKMSI